MFKRSREYKICSKTVMDTSDKDIIFDKNGISNHWYDWNNVSNKKRNSVKSSSIDKLVEKIKKEKQNEEYDCLVGISGGVDSTYVAYKVVKDFGLRPLLVHLDNGWNSREAVKNIKNIVRKLGCPLHTHVIDWDEFREMQRAYFKAGVLDIEALTDHAISAMTYDLAQKFNIQYIFKGFNTNTEFIMPKSWTFNKSDAFNIKDILKQNSNVTLNTYPIKHEKELRKLKDTVQTINVLDYIDYNDNHAREVITKELKWLPYGGKHFESVFTRFYQGYILPKKFNIDKRRAHYSNLICAGIITREAALEMLQAPIYDEEIMKQDREYVIKKLGFTTQEFSNYIQKKATSHFEFKTNMNSKIRKKWNLPSNLINRIRYSFKY